MDINHYNNLVNYLTDQTTPPHFNTQQKRQLEKQAKHYQLRNNLLYKLTRGQENIRVIRREELEPVLYMFHNDPTAAHAAREKMMDKMKIRYYWPQMYEDIRAYVESCDSCQRRGKYKRTEPLHPIPVGEPFHQIGIDYVGPLSRTTKGNRYIIVAMDYLTKWPEAKPVKEATAEETVNFVYEDIICRHGCPGRILTDRGTHFNNRLLNGLLHKFKIEHLLSTPYHPQTNGLVERFNRTLIEALSRTATDRLEEWDRYIAPVLFAYRTSRQATTGMTPFSLVYGRDAKLPTDSTRLEEERTLVDHMETQIDTMAIDRERAKIRIKTEQQKQRDRHDAKLRRVIQFQPNDKVLYYRAAMDKQWSAKLEPKWKGPYLIHKVIGNGAYQLKELDGKVVPTPVNGSYLKIYKDRTKWVPHLLI
jgi:hypothetical protein